MYLHLILTLLHSVLRVLHNYIITAVDTVSPLQCKSLDLIVCLSRRSSSADRGYGQSSSLPTTHSN